MGGGPLTRFAPREIVVFPRDPAESRAIAQRMREMGLLILARGSISGMILAATPLEGLEWTYCEVLKLWPEVSAAEQNLCGVSLSSQPEPDCPFMVPTRVPCGPG